MSPSPPIGRQHRGVRCRAGASAAAQCLALVGAVLSGLSCGAVPARAQSFDQALVMAYETNPQLLAARAQLREVDEDVPQALSGWRPQVSISASNGAAVYNNSIDRLHVPENRAPQDDRLTVDQNLFTSGRVAAQVEQARARVLSQRANLLAVETQVMLDSGTAYLDVVRDGKLLVLQRNYAAILDRTVRAATVQLAAGAITDADLAQAQSRLASQLAVVDSTAAQLQASAARFQQQIGQPPRNVAVPARSFQLPPTEDQATSASLEGNPDLVAARHALEASKLGIDIARDTLFPQVVLHILIDHTRQTQLQTYTQRTDIAQGTVEVRVPLYQGGEEYSRIRQAKEQAVRYDQLVEQARRQAQQQVETAWAALVAARSRTDHQALAAKASTVALRGISKQQAVGARTVIDVLNAQQAVLTNEVDQVVAERDALVGTLAVLAIMGKLDAAHLGLDVPAYDPTRHFDQVHEQWIGASPPRGGPNQLAPVGR